MEFLFGDLFVHASVIAVTISIIGVVVLAYRNGIFLSTFAWGVLAYMVIFVALFLSYQYGTGHVAEEAAAEPLYVLLSSVHGILSLWAIAQAAIMFFPAQKAYRAGRNFFKEHAVWTSILVLAWIASLASGFIL